MGHGNTLYYGGSNGSTLDTVASPSATDSWALDPLGNSTDAGGTARTFNSKNQIATYGGASSSITYDHDGNMTQDQNGNQYYYDAWNRLEWDYMVSGNGDQYTYDAVGRRPGLTLCNGTISNSYYSISGQDLEDDATRTWYNGFTNVTTTTLNTYVWSASYIDDIVARDQSVNGGAVSRVYAQQDANHDVTSLVNSSGTVLERFAYDPYGARTVLTAGWAGRSDAYGWLVGFQGGQLDPVTGLVNFRNRDLNPTLGVWMEQDPAGYVDGTDLYQFVDSDPTTRTDPVGTSSRNQFPPTAGGFGGFPNNGGTFGGRAYLPGVRTISVRGDWRSSDPNVRGSYIQISATSNGSGSDCRWIQFTNRHTSLLGLFPIDLSFTPKKSNATDRDVSQYTNHWYLDQAGDPNPFFDHGGSHDLYANGETIWDSPDVPNYGPILQMWIEADDYLICCGHVKAHVHWERNITPGNPGGYYGLKMETASRLPPYAGQGQLLNGYYSNGGGPSYSNNPVVP